MSPTSTLPRPKTQAIPPRVREILAVARAEGNKVFLTGQLERADYVAVDKALKAMGGKWSRKDGAHVFPFPAEDLLRGAVEDAAVVNRKKTLQFFPTPPDLAQRMVNLAGIQPGERVLEPQAGLGAILEPLLAGDYGDFMDVWAVEIDPHHVDQLADRFGEWVTLVQADFLEIARSWREQGATFDVIIMNPPFTGGQDMRHIEAAYGLLAPGGRLVALSSPSPFTHSTQAAAAFREFLDGDGGCTVEEIPPGTFKGSGTAVGTRLICKTRPLELRAEPEWDEPRVCVP